MHSISNLIETNGRTWFYVDDQHKDCFWEELTAIGARFKNGDPILRGNISMFMGIGSDKSVGHISAMIWCSSFSHPGIPLKVDYGKYIEGQENYIITE